MLVAVFIFVYLRTGKHTSSFHCRSNTPFTPSSIQDSIRSQCGCSRVVPLDYTERHNEIWWTQLAAAAARTSLTSVGIEPSNLPVQRLISNYMKPLRFQTRFIDRQKRGVLLTVNEGSLRCSCMFYNTPVLCVVRWNSHKFHHTCYNPIRNHVHDVCSSCLFFHVVVTDTSNTNKSTCLFSAFRLTLTY